MLLFNIGINTIIEQCSQIENSGIISAKHKFTCLAYADDLALLASTRYNLQCMVDVAVTFASWASLEFRPDKCGYMPCPINGDNAQIIINNKPIPKLLYNDSYRYLGVDFGRFHHQCPIDLLNNAINDFDQITKSILYPWQKIHAYSTFIHSRFTFAFRNLNIPIKCLKSFGRQNNEGIVCNKGIDPFLRHNHKLILGLPNIHYPIIYMLPEILEE